MKVLHLVKTSHGAAWALALMSELKKQGTDIHVAIPGDGPMFQKYIDAGITTHILDTDFPLFKPNIYKSYIENFRNLVKEVSPDIIHSHFVSSTLTARISLGKKHPIPRIFQVPGPLHLEHSLFRNGELFFSGINDYWIGSCRWTVNRYIKSGIEPSKIFLSYYGSNVAGFNKECKGKLRKQFNISEQAKIIGIVSFMYAPKKMLFSNQGLKGHEDLIDAFSILLKKRKDIKLVIIGCAWNNEIWYENKIKKYAFAKCGDNIIFAGRRDDIAECYSDFDIAVHPSHSENLGGAAESLLFEVPTITTNVGGFTDVVINGITGLTVRPKKPLELANSIDYLLDNPDIGKKMAHAGNKLVSEMLNVEKTAREVLSIYNLIK